MCTVRVASTRARPTVPFIFNFWATAAFAEQPEYDQSILFRPQYNCSSTETETCRTQKVARPLPSRTSPSTTLASPAASCRATTTMSTCSTPAMPPRTRPPSKGPTSSSTTSLPTTTQTTSSRPQRPSRSPPAHRKVPARPRKKRRIPTAY